MYANEEKLEKYMFITAEYVNGKIFMFCRDSNYKKVIKTVIDFLPYFYVLEDENIPENPNIIQVKSGFKSLFDEKLKKILMTDPTSVGGSRNKKGFRENFKQHWEADVRFLDRFLIDTGIKKYFYAPKKEQISWRDIYVPKEFT